MQPSACRNLSILLTAVTLLSGCAYQYHAQAIYVSPFNGNSGEYHPLPLLADSQKTAFYAQAAAFWGAGMSINRTSSAEATPPSVGPIDLAGFNAIPA